MEFDEDGGKEVRVTTGRENRKDTKEKAQGLGRPRKVCGTIDHRNGKTGGGLREREMKSWGYWRSTKRKKKRCNRRRGLRRLGK